ncbi:MAG: RNB domain-containing ribonuclease [Euryarchaeota archaeon]|nr:RNB domain-containing ribonuclease [Euryarchaeota archaeon]
MRPGTLVEFKDGLFGIKAPQNLAVFLERKKRKKDFFVVLHTVKGRREVKPQQVSGRRFTVEVDPGLDEEEMTARLKALMQEATGGTFEEKRGSEGELDERTVWERVVGKLDGPASVEDVARAWQGEEPTKGDVRRMGEMLERCKRTGVGFFERRERGRWEPIPVAAMKGFHAAMEAANRLRKRLVRTVVVEDDSGEPWERLEGVPIAAVELEDEERTLLEAFVDGMERFVLHDQWPDDVTPPGVPVHTLLGQGWHRFLEWLARDWTGAQQVTVSSAMVQFLVDSGMRTTQDTIRLIARRKVLAAPDFDWETPEEIERWAERYREPAVEASSDPSFYTVRSDLRELETYTIDPPDAKDFDDAVSLIRHDDGAATLWVHIADVSHYVEKDSRLDHHARRRATSVYLPTGVLPMLPHRLSDDLCSLREKVDRLAMSVRLEIDPAGDVVAWEPCEAVIRVDRNLSYGEVDRMVADGVEPFAGLEALARLMGTRRKGLDIETGELRIRFAESEAMRVARREGLEPESVPEPAEATPALEEPPEDDVGLSIQIKRSSPATRMIEQFMVAANEAVSRFVHGADVAVPYRCHPLPERAKAERLNGQAKTMGLEVRIDLPEESGGSDEADEDAEEEESGPSILDQLKGGKLQLGGFAATETLGKKEAKDAEDEEAEEEADLAPAIRGLAQLSAEERAAWLRPFRAALEVVEGIKDERMRDLAYFKVLSSLGRAFYTPRNLGHFGLGSTSYAHFTSPIRRYPDLVLHRQLRWVLRKDKGLDVSQEPPHMAAYLEDLCAHSSAQGERAERLERDILSCCLTFESRRQEWSGALGGIVSGVTAGGAFLTLPGNLEARVAVRDIPGGPYEVDEYDSMLFKARFGGDNVEEEELDLPLDWREMEDPATGEIREVRLKLGDRLPVTISERDFVDGKVRVRLTSGG